MFNLLKLFVARRRWAHIRACYQFGRRSASVAGRWARRRKYDALFREYCRIGALMQAHGHNLDT